MSRVTCLCCALSIAVMTTAACAEPRSTDTVSRHTPVLGDYDREIREVTPRADGVRHVDTAATIGRLREAHATTYFYLILHAETDWTDLQDEFMPAAERAGIDVWVYLVPPSECCSP